MGRELLKDDEFDQLCSSLKDVLPGLRRLLTDAGDEELRLTANAQPSLCFVELGLTRLLRRRGIEPAASAGHSVGEYAALAAAGAVSEGDALRAVVERGRAMAEALPPGESSMAAVLGLEAETVTRLLAGLDDVWPANYNTPTQTVIGGRSAPLAQAADKLRAAGARRALPLNVSAAFHTPLMRPAATRLRATVDALPWQPPARVVISNVEARPYREPASIPALLERQLYSPVRWADCVRALVGEGVDVFLEVGPKRALTGMMRELAPGAFTAAVGSPAAVASLTLP